VIKFYSASYCGIIFNKNEIILGKNPDIKKFTQEYLYEGNKDRRQ